MKFAFLSGADKNAGDFLITQRAKSLLKNEYPLCEIVDFKRNESLEPFLKDINACDVVVFAGGPGYMTDVYPNKMPLVQNLEDITPPFFAMGMGAYSHSSDLEGYSFSNSSLALLSRFEEDGFGLGCRDVLTVKALEKAGISGSVMTGCPAWYDLNIVENGKSFNGPAAGEIEHLAISDPALPENISTACSLVRYAIERLRPQRISFVFHRGWEKDRYSRGYLSRCQQHMKEWLDSQGVNVVNIAYSDEGFKVYDTCDMHIGFRVHAHIYNLSQRRASFLIEEDGRGWGINHTLKLDHIGKPTSSQFESRVRTLPPLTGLVGKPFLSRRDNEIIDRFAAATNSEINAGYPKLQAAFETMKDTYVTMCHHLRRLADAERATRSV